MTVGNYSTLKKVATTPPARQPCESGGKPPIKYIKDWQIYYNQGLHKQPNTGN